MVLFSKEYAEKVESFHDSILHENKDQDLSVIVVAHLVADKIPLCRALQKKDTILQDLYQKESINKQILSMN
jgi:hypothetical protein